MTELIGILILAWLLDCLIGDPRWLPHPVAGIALVAARAERLFRRQIPSASIAGMMTVAITLVTTATVLGLVFLVASLIGRTLSFPIAVVLLAASLALRSLVEHVLDVYTALAEGHSPDRARERLGRIVSRDTASLNRADIVRGAVESVSENMSDGVIAPLFYAVVTGVAVVLAGRPSWTAEAAALGAMLYKTVNTLDSMFGYRTEAYARFGWAAARLDDLVNWLPARITALALVAAGMITGKDWRRALAVIGRDARKHESPNAGFPEAAMAGLLGIVLGGDSTYFGCVKQKARLGDSVSPPLAETIPIAVRLVVYGSWLSFLLFLALLSSLMLLV